MKFFHQFYFRLLQYAAELARVLIMNFCNDILIFVGTFRIRNLLQKMNYYCEDYPVS